MKLDWKNVGVKEKVQSLELLHQEILKNMGDNNNICGKYAERITRSYQHNILELDF